MSVAVEYLSNKASAVEIAKHLWTCDIDFMPPLSSRVDINVYALKIADKATRFEAWLDGSLVGLLAAYCNDHEKRIAYITSVSVLKGWTGKGIAACLISRCVQHAKALGMRQICLEVASDNAPAIRLYKKSGFVEDNANAPFITMNLYLKSGEEYE